ncbi:hypothetical protein [Ruegeria faecimaris]|nr:hypothetical protein [Ruegeria faecimaris]
MPEKQTILGVGFAKKLRHEYRKKAVFSVGAARNPKVQVGLV